MAEILKLFLFGLEFWTCFDGDKEAGDGAGAGVAFSVMAKGDEDEEDVVVGEGVFCLVCSSRALL